MDEKDEETIKIVSRLAQAMKPRKKPVKLDVELDMINIKRVEEFEGLPEPGRILLEEMPKVLYLNNVAPHKVSVEMKVVHSELLVQSL